MGLEPTTRCLLGTSWGSSRGTLRCGYGHGRGKTSIMSRDGQTVSSRTCRDGFLAHYYVIITIRNVSIYPYIYIYIYIYMWTKYRTRCMSCDRKYMWTKYRTRCMSCDRKYMWTNSINIEHVVCHVTGNICGLNIEHAVCHVTGNICGLNIEHVVCHVTGNICGLNIEHVVCHVTGNICGLNIECVLCHVTGSICSLVHSSPQTPETINM